MRRIKDVRTAKLPVTGFRAEEAEEVSTLIIARSPIGTTIDMLLEDLQRRGYTAQITGSLTLTVAREDRALVHTMSFG
jgi:hypothetical protein